MIQYAKTVLVGETRFEFGVDAKRRESSAYRVLVADMRIQWRQWSLRRLWRVTPLVETRSNCARVPTAAWKSAVSTTSHSPGGGLIRNDESAARFRLPCRTNPSTCCGSPAFRQPAGNPVGMSRSRTWPIRTGHWPDHCGLGNGLRAGRLDFRQGRACFHCPPIRSTDIRYRP